MIRLILTVDRKQHFFVCKNIRNLCGCYFFSALFFKHALERTISPAVFFN